MSSQREDLPLNYIIQGDCVANMRKLPNESVDLVFADPPYNLQLQGDLLRPGGATVDAVDDHWDQYDSFQAYDEFSEKWLTEARRILKPDGAIWVIGSYHNIFRLGAKLQDMGFWIHNDVQWVKTNPMPNFQGTRFCNATETLIWAGKTKDSKLTFNYEILKTLNGGKQMRNDWHIAICNGSKRLKGKDGKKAHPTQKPDDLLYRIIVGTSHAGDVIVDPFFGSGTTGAIAKLLRRNYIGFEQEIDYVEAARERIAAVNPAHPHSLQVIQKRELPRISFNTLVESGKFPPGTELQDKSGKYKAMVMVDGRLSVPNVWPPTMGSIHAIGKKVQGAKACNGWAFWYLKDEQGNLVSIDEIREPLQLEAMRAQMALESAPAL